MKSELLRNTVTEYAQSYSVESASILFDGIVSKSTIYRWVQASRALSYAYDIDQCMREWEIIKEKEGSYNARPVHNKIVLTHQPHFYGKENELFKDKCIRNKLLKNRMRYLNKRIFTDREILRGFKISGMHIGYSHFSPLWLKKFIKEYNIQGTIYDPCGGWGHRMIAAISERTNYVYNDLWTDTYNGVSETNTLINKDNSRCEISLYNNDCTQFTPPLKYQTIFTCPPYFNTEIYNNAKFNTIQDYYIFIEKMIKHSVNSNTTTVGIVINSPYIELISKTISSMTSLQLVNEHILGSTSMKSHFNTNSNKKEVLLVFKKVY